NGRGQEAAAAEAAWRNVSNSAIRLASTAKRAYRGSAMEGAWAPSCDGLDVWRIAAASAKAVAQGQGGRGGLAAQGQDAGLDEDAGMYEDARRYTNLLEEVLEMLEGPGRCRPMRRKAQRPRGPSQMFEKRSTAKGPSRGPKGPLEMLKGPKGPNCTSIMEK